MGAILETIRDRLNDAFQPTRLEVVDDSARHAGHAGARAGGESHFNVTIQSEVFVGASRIARQRMVHKALEAELAGPVHALAIRALAPGED